jgi:hypothetical protein
MKHSKILRNVFRAVNVYSSHGCYSDVQVNPVLGVAPSVKVSAATAGQGKQH